MSYDQTGRGQLWGNKDKEKETDRDFQGSINIEGVEYWLSGWKRKQDAHPQAPALTLKATLKESKAEDIQNQIQQTPQQQAPQQQAQQPADGGLDWDSDIPF